MALSFSCGREVVFVCLFWEGCIGLLFCLIELITNFFNRLGFKRQRTIILNESIQTFFEPAYELHTDDIPIESVMILPHFSRDSKSSIFPMEVVESDS